MFRIIKNFINKRRISELKRIRRRMSGTQPAVVRFCYEKSSPSGLVQLVLYKDVRALPGPLDVEALTKGDDGASIIREADAAVLLHPEVVRRVIELLECITSRSTENFGQKK